MWLKEIKNQEKDLVLHVKQKCSTYCMKNGKVQIKVNFTDGPLKTISGNPRMILSITKPNSGD